MKELLTFLNETLRDYKRELSKRGPVNRSPHATLYSTRMHWGLCLYIHRMAMEYDWLGDMITNELYKQRKRRSLGPSLHDHLVTREQALGPRIEFLQDLIYYLKHPDK